MPTVFLSSFCLSRNTASSYRACRRCSFTVPLMTPLPRQHVTYHPATDRPVRIEGALLSVRSREAVMCGVRTRSPSRGRRVRMRRILCATEGRAISWRWVARLLPVAAIVLFLAVPQERRAQQIIRSSFALPRADLTESVCPVRAIVGGRVVPPFPLLAAPFRTGGLRIHLALQPR